MMLCKLSLKNIKKSFKDYAIYFFTLILGVAIFYVFNSIESQTAMMKITEKSPTYEIIDLMTNVLSGVSVFVSFILGFLIIYASRFLIKRRNKEFGIYLTLGMSKRKISTLLFFETLLIGIISLLVGLCLGIVASQFMSIIVANMFEADMSKFTFVFSMKACIKTLIYFAIMYLIVMVFNTISVNRCKLIDLLHSSKKTEKIRLKNPWICTIIFIISCIVLGIAYYYVTLGFNKINDFNQIFIIIIAGVISTFFIFWSISGLLLKIFSSIKRVYYKGLNTFTLRQISSKVNTTVFSMTIICIMLFITICVLSSSLSIKNSSDANLKTLVPVDIVVSKTLNLDISPNFDPKNSSQNLIDDTKLSINESLNKERFDSNKYFKDTVIVNTYGTNDFSMIQSLGSKYKSISEQFPFMLYDQAEQIIKISDYNKLAKLYGLKTYSLKSDEYMIISNYDSVTNIRNQALEADTKITILGKTYKPKYKKCKDGYIEQTSNKTNIGVFVVPDNVNLDSIKFTQILAANYKASTKGEKNKIEKLIRDVYDSDYFRDTTNVCSSKLGIYEANTGVSALIVFVGIYIGIIFLISSAAILALKELSESSDNKERYNMLRKIGVDEKMINKALFRQIGIFFIIPLLLALLHSYMGIIFCTKILEVFGTKGLLPSILMTAIILIIVYGGYFILTYLCSKKIIKEQ